MYNDICHGNHGKRISLNVKFIYLRFDGGRHDVASRYATNLLLCFSLLVFNLGFVFFLGRFYIFYEKWLNIRRGVRLFGMEYTAFLVHKG